MEFPAFNFNRNLKYLKKVMIKTLSTYTKHIPYLYFISIIAFWFTIINRNDGLIAYPILLLIIPFLWQIMKPHHYLNFLLGVSFISITSFLMFFFIFNQLHILNEPRFLYFLLIYGGIIIPANFIMAFWMIRNSLKRSL